MRKLCVLTLFILVSAPIALAQGSDDYHKLEVYGGYSLGRFESSTNSLTFRNPGGSQTYSNLCSAATGEQLGPNSQKFFCQRRNFNGFDGSVTYNLNQYVGIKADITGHFKTETFVDKFNPPGVTQTIAVRERLYNFLGGVQVKNNSKTRRFKPFGHALVGLGRYTNSQAQTIDLFPQFNFVAEDRTSALAMKLGAGLDIRVSKRIDVRLIEFDYNPLFARDRSYKSISGPFTFTSTGKTAHNFTFGIGIVIH
jgi:opacity protein-like surface antigen